MIKVGDVKPITLNIEHLLLLELKVLDDCH